MRAPDGGRHHGHDVRHHRAISQQPWVGVCAQATIRPLLPGWRRSTVEQTSSLSTARRSRSAWPAAIIIDGVSTDPNHPVLRRLAEGLHRHYCGDVSVKVGVQAEQIGQALLLLSTEPRHDGQLGLAAGGAPTWPHIKRHPLTFVGLSLIGSAELTADGSGGTGDTLGGRVVFGPGAGGAVRRRRHAGRFGATIRTIRRRAGHRRGPQRGRVAAFLGMLRDGEARVKVLTEDRASNAQPANAPTPPAWHVWPRRRFRV